MGHAGVFAVNAALAASQWQHPAWTDTLHPSVNVEHEPAVSEAFGMTRTGFESSLPGLIARVRPTVPYVTVHSPRLNCFGLFRHDLRQLSYQPWFATLLRVCKPPSSTIATLFSSLLDNFVNPSVSSSAEKPSQRCSGSLSSAPSSNWKVVNKQHAFCLLTHLDKWWWD